MFLHLRYWAAIAIKPSRRLIVLFLLAETGSVLLDALRLQPWEYMYLFIFLFSAIYINQPQKYYRALLLVLSSTYIFTGIHKFSGAFLNNVWDSFLLYRLFGFTKPHISPVLHYSGLLLGSMEFACGLALLLFTNKRLPACLLISMHAVILIVLGIMLKGHNYSVFPWNVLMMFLLIYIYKEQTALRSGFSGYLAPPYFLLFVFWFALPLANVFGYWAHYLSSGMYTGKTPQGLCMC
ncbi:hypothetical protein ACLI09_09820 [Flavobacterium sp. RHBU_24]|uniref:hypothetical protein n=1 Tax=Flavobacterium sp. RHBU_24 TaxID=3391185 RepID=UPI003985556B